VSRPSIGPSPGRLFDLPRLDAEEDHIDGARLRRIVRDGGRMDRISRSGISTEDPRSGSPQVRAARDEDHVFAGLGEPRAEMPAGAAGAVDAAILIAPAEYHPRSLEVARRSTSPSSSRERACRSRRASACPSSGKFWRSLEKTTTLSQRSTRPGSFTSVEYLAAHRRFLGLPVLGLVRDLLGVALLAPGKRWALWFVATTVALPVRGLRSTDDISP
jgi:hypothetical protein